MTVDEILYKIICEVSGCYDDEEVTDKKAIAQAKAELRKLIESKKLNQEIVMFNPRMFAEVKLYNQALDAVLKLFE